MTFVLQDRGISDPHAAWHSAERLHWVRTSADIKSGEMNPKRMKFWLCCSFVTVWSVCWLNRLPVNWLINLFTCRLFPRTANLDDCNWSVNVSSFAEISLFFFLNIESKFHRFQPYNQDQKLRIIRDTESWRCFATNDCWHTGSQVRLIFISTGAEICAEINNKIELNKKKKYK